MLIIYWVCTNEDCEASQLPSRPVAVDDDGVAFEPSATVCATCNCATTPEGEAYLADIQARTDEAMAAVDPKL